MSQPTQEEVRRAKSLREKVEEMLYGWDCEYLPHLEKATEKILSLFASEQAEMVKEKEICICAAVQYNGKVWRGHRHPNAMQAQTDELSYTMNREQMMKERVSREQGFITSKNRFVDRKEGLGLQIAAGIPSASKDGYRSELYSEDLY